MSAELLRGLKDIGSDSDRRAAVASHFGLLLVDGERRTGETEVKIGGPAG